MSDQAATPTGGAEVSARPQEAQAPSVHERLKAQIFGTPEKAADESSGVAPNMGKPQEQPQQEAKAEQEVEEAEEAADEPTEDAPEEEQQEQNFDSFEELAEALGWSVDKLYGLSSKTKIDGKEGKATLRDLIKSHQLEGHLNQKLMTHAEEKKAFETERQNFLQTSQHKLQQLDVGVKLAQKLLEGEFANVNWQELQNTDPLAFNQQYVSFQQRQAQINHIANLLGQENQNAQKQAEAQQQSYLQEQMKLMETKLPEWADKSRREKDIVDIIPIAKEVYGVSEEEVRSLKDHREILILRDAWQWQKLQKAKPAITNKVKAAPKLLKPGATQSKAASTNLQLQQDRARLKGSGKVRDAKPVLKKLLFG